MAARSNGRRQHWRTARRAVRAELDQRERQFRADVEHLHSLGPRPIGELLVELAATHLIRTEVENLLRRYRRLDTATVARIGGRFWQ